MAQSTHLCDILFNCRQKLLFKTGSSLLFQKSTRMLSSELSTYKCTTGSRPSWGLAGRSCHQPSSTTGFATAFKKQQPTSIPEPGGSQTVSPHLSLSPGGSRSRMDTTTGQSVRLLCSDQLCFRPELPLTLPDRQANTAWDLLFHLFLQ